MLKPINSVANRVAEGRRFASRSVVITNLSSIECLVFRRSVVPAVEGESREDTIWEGGMMLSEQEEHATEYQEQGYAMLLLDKFSGGSIHSSGDDINSGEAMFYAQIEPFHYADYESKANMLRNTPDWKPEKGDILAMVVNADLIKWVEVVGVTGQSLHAQHGERYVLNIRDNLMHLEPFIHHEDLLKPKSNIFPIGLDKLMYSDAPIFEVDDKGTTNLSDDQVQIKQFKLVNIADPQLQNYHAVLSIVHLFKRTNSPYFFQEQDQAKIQVDIADGERFILTADSPVRAIDTPQGPLSYMLVMIDHVALVRKIDSELTAFRPVQVKHGDRVIFELMPLQFDEVRKAYHFTCAIILGQVMQYDLTFENGEKHSLTIDATALEGAD